MLDNSHKAANIISSTSKAIAAAKAAASIGQQGRCGSCLTCRQQRQVDWSYDGFAAKSMLCVHCPRLRFFKHDCMIAGQQPAVPAAAGSCRGCWWPCWRPGTMLFLARSMWWAASQEHFAHLVRYLSELTFVVAHSLQRLPCTVRTAYCADCHYKGGCSEQAGRNLVGR
jgi:hypothetical protein